MRTPVCPAGPRHEEAGVALITAMFALAVIGALLAGSFLPGRLELQSGYNVGYAAQAREAAEAGLVQAIGAIEAPVLEALMGGGPALDLGTTSLGEMLTVHATAARLTGRLFILESQGTRHDASGGELATRRLGLLVQLGAAHDSAGAPGVPAVIPLAERSWVRLY